jgi:hypothetical protein
MKFIQPPRPFTDPDVAARKLVEIANGIEAAQDSRLFIGLLNAPFLKAGELPTTSAPGSSAPLRSVGCGGMNQGPI